MQQIDLEKLPYSLGEHIKMLLKMEEAGYQLVTSSHQGFFERNWESSEVAKFTVEYHSELKIKKDQIESDRVMSLILKERQTV